MAQMRNYNDARINLLSVNRLLQRGLTTPQHLRDFISFCFHAEKLDSFMRETQQYEEVFGWNFITSRDGNSSKAIYQQKGLSKDSFNA